MRCHAPDVSEEAPPTAAGPPSPEEEVLYGRGQDARVFVSSQMRDSNGEKVYEEERATLADAVDGIPRMQSWLWERDAPVGEYSA